MLTKSNNHVETIRKIMLPKNCLRLFKNVSVTKDTEKQDVETLPDEKKMKRHDDQTQSMNILNLV